MRALIVLGGDLPSPPLLRRCASEAELTIAADRGLEAFEAAGVLPDLLLGDMDSVSAGTLARREGSTEMERLPCEKDDTDGGHAMEVALSRGATEITILGALGGRMDHALANLMLLNRAHEGGAFAQILDERVRIVRIDGEIALRGAKGDTISLIPIGEAHGVTLTGCYYHSREALSFDFVHPLGVSNVVTDDEARITVKAGDLLLFHHYSGI